MARQSDTEVRCAGGAIPPPLAGEVARRSPKGEGAAGGGSIRTPVVPRRPLPRFARASLVASVDHIDVIRRVITGEHPRFASAASRINPALRLGHRSRHEDEVRPSRRPHRCWGDEHVTQTGGFLRASRIRQVSSSEYSEPYRLLAPLVLLSFPSGVALPRLGSDVPQCSSARPDWDRPVGYSAALSSAATAQRNAVVRGAHGARRTRAAIARPRSAQTPLTPARSNRRA